MLQNEDERSEADMPRRACDEHSLFCHGRCDSRSYLNVAVSLELVLQRKELRVLLHIAELQWLGCVALLSKHSNGRMSRTPRRLITDPAQ
jgi:hypothetical protein